MASEVFVKSLPACDFQPCSNLAEYDFKTRQGPWANACSRHWRFHRASETLGTGHGQKLLVKEAAK